MGGLGDVGPARCETVQLPPTPTTKVSFYGRLYFHTNQIGIIAYVMSLPVSCYLKITHLRKISKNTDVNSHY